MKALFLDRDGVINEDYGYVHSPCNFLFKTGIFEFLSKAMSANYKIIVITNQAGIGRGYYTEEDFFSLNKWMVKKFELKNIKILQTYWCPHHPTHGIGDYKKQCNFRKPNPGMILKAAKDHRLSLPDCILVGDKTSDIKAGFNAKIGRLILFGNEKIKKISHENITSFKEIKL